MIREQDSAKAPKFDSIRNKFRENGDVAEGVILMSLIAVTALLAAECTLERGADYKATGGFNIIYLGDTPPAYLVTLRPSGMFLTDREKIYSNAYSKIKNDTGCDIKQIINQSEIITGPSSRLHESPVNQIKHEGYQVILDCAPQG